MSTGSSELRGVALFVVPSFSGGGAERCGLEVLRALEPSRYERLLLPIHREGEYSEELPDHLVVPSRRPRSRRVALPRWVRKWLFPTLEVARAVKHLRPDVVVTFLPEASLPTSLVRWLHLAPRFLWLVSEQNATRRRVVEGNPSVWRRWIQDRWIGLAYRTADHVIAVSAGVRSGLIEDYRLAGERCSVIFNPVDVRRVRAAAAEPPALERANPQLIVAVGRLTRQKGFDVLLRAVARLRTVRPVDLVILGTGEDRTQLEHLARELGIGREVQFPGFQSNPWSYLGAADVFVLSSRWEGCPLVIAEALACGTPVVATDCDYGPAELIEDEHNGLLVPTESPPALADAVLRILTGSRLAARLAAAGCRRAEDLDVATIAGRYDALIASLRQAAELTAPTGRNPIR